MILCCGLMIVAAIVSPVSAETTVHDVRLGFEEVELPEGWRVLGGPGYSFKRDTEVRRTGKASGLVSVKSGLGDYGFPGPTYRIPDLEIPEGEAYKWELSFYCKTRMAAWGKKGTGSLYAAVEYLGADGKRLRVEQSNFIGGTTDWHKVTLKGSADHKCRSMNVRVISYGPGEAWVDDIRFVVAAPGELRLAGVFGDNAVLQRDVPVPVWGWAKPNTEIAVTFAGQTKSGTADADGKWRVTLDPMPASAAGRELRVRSQGSGGRGQVAGGRDQLPPDSRPLTPENITIRDVLVGDVWLCSGQSNMALHMGYCAKHPPIKKFLAELDNPLLRLGSVPPSWPAEPLRDVACTWQKANARSARGFSAIGCMFGDRLQRELGVPVGIMNASRGGTWIENWIPGQIVETSPSCDFYMKQYRKALANYPEAKAKYDEELARFNARQQAGDKSAKKPRVPRGPETYNRPGSLFNGMIAPLVPCALKGVLWYQGEGNVWGFSRYDKQMGELISSWRGLFGQPGLPFCMTELAPLGEPSPTPQDNPRCRFGVALAKGAKAAGHAWTITITDGGERKDIHPRYKDIPAERFAAMALAKVYGKAGVCHGPVLKSWQAEDGKAVLTFESVGSGLTAQTVTLDGHELSAKDLVGFELADENRRFFRAKAEVRGPDTVVVSCPDVPEPAAVRYAWAKFPLCNLYNREGFAAYPFRTDDWPVWTPPWPARK